MIPEPKIQIDRIYVDANAEKTPLANRILKKLCDVPVTIVKDRKRFLAVIGKIPLYTGKRSLWLSRFKGAFLKPCPATGSDYLCCQYWVINVQTHCPLECSYCILQQYLNIPSITVYVNMENVIREVESLIAKHPACLIRMGTGELTDSLALDSITHINERLIHAFSKKKMILEIKTKTAFIKHLPKIPKGNSVVSWSLNPDTFIRSEELKSACLDDRLKAALQALKKGYRLGFHFDPLLMLPSWERKYKDVIQKLTQVIPEKEVLWISLGSLRFPPPLKKDIAVRFPKSLITTSEFVRALDGKLRYFRPARTEMYRKVYAMLREHWKNVFIYLCMENKTVWQDVMGFSPEDNGHLDYLFHENIARRFRDLALPTANRKKYSVAH